MPNGRGHFRGIKEVAEELGAEQHILRYWEGQFKEIQPRRRGSRRMYRPEDVLFIAGIKKFMHEDKITTKAAQRIIAEEGVEHVRNVGRQYLDDMARYESDPSARQLSKSPDSASGGRSVPEQSSGSIREAENAYSADGKTCASATGGRPATESIDLGALRSILEKLRGLRAQMAAESP